MAHACIIIESRSGFRVGVSSADESVWQETNADTANLAPVRERLGENGVGAHPVAVAMRTVRVSAINCDVEGRTKSQRQKSLAYSIEEHSPLSVEEFTCRGELRKTRTLGCWVESETCQDIVDRLAEEGVVAAILSPVTMLAAQEVCSSQEIDSCVCIMPYDDAIEVVVVESGLPAYWARVLSCEGTLQRELQFLESYAGPRLVIATEDNAIVAGDAHFERLHLDVDDLALSMAARVARQSTRPWFDFLGEEIRSEELVRIRGRSERLLLGTLLCLVGALLVALNIFASRVGAKAAELRDKQVAIFEDLYPGERTPVGIRRRLQIRLDELSGTRTESAQPQGRTDALLVFLKTVTSLPDDMRFQVAEISIDRERVRILGSIREHSDAERFMSSLSSAGFVVEPPLTERTAGREVTFDLAAQYHPETPQ